MGVVSIVSCRISGGQGPLGAPKSTTTFSTKNNDPNNSKAKGTFTGKTTLHIPQVLMENFVDGHVTRLDLVVATLFETGRIDFVIL